MVIRLGNPLSPYRDEGLLKVSHESLTERAASNGVSVKEGPNPNLHGWPSPARQGSRGVLRGQLLFAVLAGLTAACGGQWSSVRTTSTVGSRTISLEQARVLAGRKMLGRAVSEERLQVGRKQVETGRAWLCTS